MGNFISYKNIKIHYTDSGKGETIVLLHGFLENYKMWNPLVSELTSKNRIICIDLLGHGKTECLGYIHTMEAMADAVKCTIDYLNIKNIILAGHSMGGYVALALTEFYPNSIKKLILINSTAKSDNKSRVLIRNKAIEAVKLNYDKVIKASIRNLFRPKNRNVFKKEIEIVLKEALKTPIQGYIAAQEGMKIRSDRSHVLKNKGFKKMMIISKKDPVLNYDSLVNQNKNVFEKVSIFPDGHMSYIENEEVFLREIVHFIEYI